VEREHESEGNVVTAGERENERESEGNVGAAGEREK
jgi:hypothetical protein